VRRRRAPSHEKFALVHGNAEAVVRREDVDAVRERGRLRNDDLGLLGDQIPKESFLGYGFVNLAVRVVGE